MGSILGKSMEENFKKQQEFMLMTGQMQLERQIQMQNAMRERQMAMQIARGRDLFLWWGSFYTVASTAMVVGFMKKRNPAVLAPLLPLTFIVGYMYDMGYGSKLERMKDEADRIMDNEKTLLVLPHGLPTFSDIEKARLAEKDAQILQKGHDIFL
ncbi:plasminogen receptor (KT)-like isoform X2 [Pomacea canaliculata]|nr:plasminogen receptor (KT)-like isoform X2 [Pomacea canaliculata]XP_025110920.1 plasminogen receptor (KT)-like isoform X2 [Pomacea canaliculata]XP_025110921.1 plasminogen receptor (KT)-like isoform X2 [Pomacea canaliculata]